MNQLRVFYINDHTFILQNSNKRKVNDRKLKICYTTRNRIHAKKSFKMTPCIYSSRFSVRSRFDLRQHKTVCLTHKRIKKHLHHLVNYNLRRLPRYHRFLRLAMPSCSVLISAKCSAGLSICLERCNVLRLRLPDLRRGRGSLGRSCHELYCNKKQCDLFLFLFHCTHTCLKCRTPRDFLLQQRQYSVLER